MAKSFLDTTGLDALWLKLKTAISELVVEVSGKVSKDGDTMSGDLKMDGHIIDNAGAVATADLDVYAIHNGSSGDAVVLKSPLQATEGFFMESTGTVGTAGVVVQGDGQFRDISDTVDSTTKIPTCAAVNNGLAGKADTNHTHSSISTGSTAVETDGSNVLLKDSNGNTVLKVLNPNNSKEGIEIFGMSNSSSTAEFSSATTTIKSPFNSDTRVVLGDDRANIRSANDKYVDISSNSMEIKHPSKISIKTVSNSDTKEALTITPSETTLKNAATGSMGVRLKSTSTECKFSGKGLTLTGTESKLTATTAVRLLAPDVYVGAEDDPAKLHLNGTELGSTIQYLEMYVDSLRVQPHVELMCLAKKLYIICDTGYIKSTDSVVLFRYVRSNNRYSTYSNQKRNTKGRRRTIGWKEPLIKPSGSTTYQKAVPLQLHQETEFTTLAANKDVWQVCQVAGSTVSTIIDVFKTKHQANFYLFGKKCGVRIQRDDEWVTGYLPFMAQKAYDLSTGVTTYGIGRWQT